MLCPDCHTYADDDEIVCPRCGRLLDRSATEEEELMNFRQGRHLRQAAEEVPPPPVTPGSTGASRSFEDTRPRETAESTGAFYGRRETLAGTGRFYGMDDDAQSNMPLTYSVSATPTVMAMRPTNVRTRRLQRGRLFINWLYVLIACVILVVAGLIGGYAYLKNTENGQVILARLGQDASAAAMWQVGQEYQRIGDIEKAISYFEIARDKNTADKTPNVTGLMQLGSAYEAAGMLAEAEEVYAYVYTELTPDAPEAYRSQVRVLLAQDRKAEAALLLQTAYKQTGQNSFRTQRADILPEVPTASILGGYYNAAQTIELMQDQEDRQIWYTLDTFAVLPEVGILYEGPITLSEGEHELRAVAVIGDLVSDEMEFNYQIYLPTPLQPDSNLAPNTYSSKRKVTLKPGSLSEEDLEKNPGYAKTLDDPVAQTITIYYTIDGSMPDKDSPIYNGEPIQLGTYGGYVVLQAVAVNGYGKQGNMLYVKYKFDTSPSYRKMYNTDDVIADLKLGVTTREAFRSKYGEGQGPERVLLGTVEGECEKYVYDWGHATFMKVKTGWTLAELYFDKAQFSGPRKTGIGSSEKDITSQFKDCCQPVGATGIKRGLYFESEKKLGAISILESGEKIIYYRVNTADGHVWQLEYHLSDKGVTEAIRWVFER